MHCMALYCVLQGEWAPVVARCCGSKELCMCEMLHTLLQREDTKSKTGGNDSLLQTRYTLRFNRFYVKSYGANDIYAIKCYYCVTLITQ